MKTPIKSHLPEGQESFLQKFTALVEEGLSDPGLNIAGLAGKLKISRAQFYRKVKTLTGKSPSMFIRSARLENARRLLEMTDLNVSEIAYESGFNDHSYFTRIFREEYGLAPSAWRKR